MPRVPQPDFLIIGAPKAGTTALHTALTQHPDAFLTQPKEPKYWLCDDAPPPHWNGPGDRHSQQEWVWRSHAYAKLFEGARDDQVRGESTPFYLWSLGAHRRIGEALPDVKLIAVVRDPVDRAYSNWMHLWSDGLEAEPDFRRAFDRERERVLHGYAPFWRYRELGLYGEQLEHLYDHVPREQVLVMRYRALVDEPSVAVDTACRFLGIREGLVDTIPRDNARTYAEPGWRTRTLGPVVRGAATLAQFAPPELWRRASVPLVAQLSGRDTHRPHLSEEQRAELIQEYADDIGLLSRLTGESFHDWLSPVSRGSFDQRSSQSRARNEPSTGASED